MRFQLRPPVRERLRLGDQAGMSRYLLMVSIDDSADRGRISEPVSETDSNEGIVKLTHHKLRQPQDIVSKTTSEYSMGWLGFSTTG